jgi:hypothetical protein
MAVLRRAGILIVAGMLVLGLAGTLAVAKKKHKKVRHWPSQVTLTHPTETQFAGVVSSKLKACRKSRVIALYYTDPNTQQTQPLSVQRTDGGGRYQVNLAKPAFAGNYQVQLIARRIRAMKAPQICKAAQSTVVTTF